jgi:hypothetical protein
MKLFVDDIRMAPDKTWNVVRTFEGAVYAIKVFSNLLTEISLDHDLGVFPDPHGKDGAGIAKLLVEMALDGKLNKDIKITCHSMNPVGVKNIQGYIRDIYKILES